MEEKMIKLVQRELLSCEAIVRRAPNGELLLVCQCGDVTEPAPLNRVYVWHSRDDGENWSERLVGSEMCIRDRTAGRYIKRK